MKLIVCVSDNMGMAFNNRRQSRDAKVCEDILKTAGEKGIYLSPYSATLFADNEKCIYSDNYLYLAGEDEYVFCEKDDVADICSITEIILYKWNRSYPADLFFKLPAGFRMVTNSLIKGKSHDKITKEIYRNE